MKIHMDKKQTEERTSFMQFIRLASATAIYELHAWYELNDEEQQLLDAHPDVEDAKVFDYEYEGLDLSPNVKDLVNRDDGGMRFVAYNSASLMELENEVNEGAKYLKGHLENLKGMQGSSVTEI